MASRGTRKITQPISNQNLHVFTSSMLTSTRSLHFFASFTKRLSFKYIPVTIMIFAAFFLVSISSNTLNAFESPSIPPRNYVVEVVNEFPHDSSAFTEGLLYGGNDTLYESTGLYNQSSVRRVDMRTGEVLALYKLNSSYFGEGLTLIGERLYQVTWLEKIGFIYDRNNFSEFQRFTHHMKDGWGLATDGRCLFGTDGSSTLYHFDPRNMKVLQERVVTYNDHEVHDLNELEYINDEVWANVWQTDCIARISLKDGVVREWILLHSLRERLLAAGEKNIDVLNGIAWDKEKNRIFVTGKLWPKLFEIKLQPMRKEHQGTIEDMCMPKRYHFLKH